MFGGDDRSTRGLLPRLARGSAFLWDLRAQPVPLEAFGGWHQTGADDNLFIYFLF